MGDVEIRTPRDREGTFEQGDADCRRRSGGVKCALPASFFCLLSLSVHLFRKENRIKKFTKQASHSPCWVYNS